MTTLNPTPQQILDEQGYIAFATTRSHQIGDIVGDLGFGDSPRLLLPSPVVITGHASRDEYIQQCRRFWGRDGLIPPNWMYFYKAIAE